MFVASPYTVPSAGTYRVTVRGKGTINNDPDGPRLSASIGGATTTNSMMFGTTTYEEKYVDIVVPASGTGANTISINFFNDGNSALGDRNVYMDYIKVTGPLGTGTGTTRSTAAKTKINTLYSRILYRDATATERDAAYSLLSDLTSLGTLTSSWSGVCEALVRHPDFLFTMPPRSKTSRPFPRRTSCASSRSRSVHSVARPLLQSSPSSQRRASRRSSKTSSRASISATTTSTAFSSASRARALRNQTSPRGCGRS